MGLKVEILGESSELLVCVCAKRWDNASGRFKVYESGSDTSVLADCDIKKKSGHSTKFFRSMPISISMPR